MQNLYWFTIIYGPITEVFPASRWTRSTQNSHLDARVERANVCELQCMLDFGICVYAGDFDSVLFMSNNGFSVGRRPSFCAALACPSMKWPCCLVTGEAAPSRKKPTTRPPSLEPVLSMWTQNTGTLDPSQHRRMAKPKKKSNKTVNAVLLSRITSNIIYL